MFWFKPSALTVDFFTADAIAYEYAFPIQSSKILPDWWKNLSNDKPSLKHCRGFTTLFKNSFVIPSWGLFTFDIGSEKESSTNWNASNVYGSKTPVEFHEPSTYKGMFSPSHPHQHVKLVSPWYAKTKDFINFAWIDSVYNRNNMSDYIVMPGMVDFKYQWSTNVNLLLRYDPLPRKVTILPGQPLVMLVPQTEKKIIIKHHLLTEQEIKKYDMEHKFYDPSFDGIVKKYNRKKDFITRADNLNKIKCPFSR